MAVGINTCLIVEYEGESDNEIKVAVGGAR